MQTLPERAMPTHLCPQFVANVKEVAAANGLTPEAVYAMWHKYSCDCRDYDQSAIFSEFLSWYRATLPVLPEGMHRLG